jgi:2-dehydropantoate 2-reductase
LKFAIYGAGAVGSFIGARLLEGGHDVRFIARGPNLGALRDRGLIVKSRMFGERRYKVRAAASAGEVGSADYVVLGVKANALTEIAPLVGPLKHSRTRFISTQNGLPWWYFHGVPGEQAPIKAVDPGGVIARHIPAPIVVGSIVYFSCSMTGPGEVEHTAGARLPLGVPSGGRSERVLALSSALRAVGLKSPVRHDIRHELWVKLLGNAALNPLSALTRKALADLIDSPHGRRLIEAMMDEVREVASAVGVHIALSNERRIAGARAAGYHRTSMLQDLERGRVPEIDALLGAVIELAERNHVVVPTLQAIDATARVLFQDTDSERA